MRPDVRSAVLLAPLALALAAGKASAAEDGQIPRDAPAQPSEKTPGPAGTWFQTDVGIGYRAIDLTSFEARRTRGGTGLTADLVPNEAGGPEATLGAAARLGFLTLGLRGTLAHFEDSSTRRTVNGMNLYTIDAELGLSFLQLGRFVPGIVLGGGYSTFGGLDDAVEGATAGLDIDGANLRFALALDYYASPLISFGLRAGADVLFLSRPGVPIRQLASLENVSDEGDARALILQGDGSSVGTALFLGVGPAFHF